MVRIFHDHKAVSFLCGGTACEGLTFRAAASSIPQETRMGTMRLALPWEARISPGSQGLYLQTLRENGQLQREIPVEPSGFAQRGSSPAADFPVDDGALASACRSGDLRGFERLYHLHGPRMKSVL